jgi:hypothetical protein
MGKILNLAEFTHTPQNHVGKIINIAVFTQALASGIDSHGKI